MPDWSRTAHLTHTYLHFLHCFNVKGQWCARFQESVCKAKNQMNEIARHDYKIIIYQVSQNISQIVKEKIQDMCVENHAFRY